MPKQTSMRVEAHRTLTWPDYCVCCNSASEGNVFTLTSSGRKADDGKTEKHSIPVPCCDYCSKHWHEEESRYLAGGIMFVIALGPLFLSVTARAILLSVTWLREFTRIYLLFIAPICILIGIALLIRKKVQPVQFPITENCAASVPVSYRFVMDPPNDKDFPIDSHRQDGARLARSTSIQGCFSHRFSLIFNGYEGYEKSGESRLLCRLGRRQGKYRRRVSPYSLLLCT